MSDVRGPLRGLKPRRFYQKISRSMFHHQQRSLVQMSCSCRSWALGHSALTKPWSMSSKIERFGVAEPATTVRVLVLPYFGRPLPCYFTCRRLYSLTCICLVVLSCDPPASFSFHCIPFRKFSVYRWAFQGIPHFRTHPMIRFDRILCHWDGYWRKIHWTSPWFSWENPWVSCKDGGFDLVFPAPVPRRWSAIGVSLFSYTWSVFFLNR